MQNETTTFSGFIAQEVEKAAKDAGYEFSGVVRPQSEQDVYSLRYSDFVVPLVKAVQELNQKNEKQEQLISEQTKMMQQQQEEIDLLKKRLDQLESKSK